MEGGFPDVACFPRGVELLKGFPHLEQLTWFPHEQLAFPESFSFVERPVGAASRREGKITRKGNSH
ncbi:MAG TPA: hypothetical protein IGS40_03830 [Trichormus sp. M33_DOE_039]|nr:hypothetical protein [Trichormus sp. M33_DOE_039]